MLDSCQAFLNSRYVVDFPFDETRHSYPKYLYLAREKQRRYDLFDTHLTLYDQGFTPSDTKLRTIMKDETGSSHSCAHEESHGRWQLGMKGQRLKHGHMSQSTGSHTFFTWGTGSVRDSGLRQRLSTPKLLLNKGAVKVADGPPGREQKKPPRDRRHQTTRPV
jgi:hypothetical protein